jgi:nucleotide-binding universal stress UspA family protein
MFLASGMAILEAIAPTTVFYLFLSSQVSALFLRFLLAPATRSCRAKVNAFMLGIKTILHPTDFSEPSTHALDLATRLAADYGASLVVVHVMSVPDLDGDDRFSAAQVSLKDLHASWSTEESDPDRAARNGAASEILNLAEVCNADLIVMGSRGREGQCRGIMGSVAEAILLEAGCPVLTVSQSHAQRWRPPRRPADWRTAKGNGTDHR